MPSFTTRTATWWRSTGSNLRVFPLGLSTVLWFSACDGPTDPQGRDGASCVVRPGGDIQACINSLPNAGGTVLVRAGLYELRQHITIDRSNVRLVGEGPATLLRLADGARQAVIVIGSPADLGSPGPGSPPIISNVSISQVAIDGNRDQQHPEDPDWEYEAAPLLHLRLNGITIRRSSDVTISDVIITGARSGGIVSELGVSGLLVANVVVRGAFFDGIGQYATMASRIVNSLLEGNDHSGLSADLDFELSLVANNLILANGRRAAGIHPNYQANHPGVYLAGSHDNVLSGNLIDGSGGDGIHLTKTIATCSARNYFVGNTISNSGAVAVSAPHPDCGGTNNVGSSTCYRGNAGTVYQGAPGQYLDVHVACPGP